MKSYPLCVTMILGVSALWLWKVMHEDTEPPPRLIQDMAQPPERPHSSPPPGAIPLGGIPKDEATEGKELFLLHCAACHGAKGTGKSYVSQQPGMPEISDLTASDSTPEEQLRTLAEGKGAMPAFGTRLSEATRQQLILYLQTLK